MASHIFTSSANMSVSVHMRTQSVPNAATPFLAPWEGDIRGMWIGLKDCMFHMFPRAEQLPTSSSCMTHPQTIDKSNYTHFHIIVKLLLLLHRMTSYSAEVSHHLTDKRPSLCALVTSRAAGMHDRVHQVLLITKIDTTHRHVPHCPPSTDSINTQSYILYSWHKWDLNGLARVRCACIKWLDSWNTADLLLLSYIAK